MKQCEYCAKEISYYDQYCSKECEDNAKRYYDLTRNKRKLFSFFNFTGLLTLIIGLFWMLFQVQVGAYITGAALLVVGILFFFFPFGTPEMLQKFKIEKMKKIVKMMGITAVVIGIVLVILGLFVLTA